MAKAATKQVKEPTAHKRNDRTKSSHPPKSNGRRRSVQTELPGMETPKIQELIDAAQAYVDVRDERMKLTELEVDRRTALLELMHKHKLTTYKFEDLVIEVDMSEKVKVKVKKDDDEGLGL